VNPLKDYVKINADASFDVDLLRGTSGVVIWDNNGRFIAAENTKLEYVQDAMSSQAHDNKQGTILAQSMGCNRVILSSDCLEVVDILKEEGNTLGIAIIDDC
jgi:hypothetical protein